MFWGKKGPSLDVNAVYAALRTSPRVGAEDGMQRIFSALSKAGWTSAQIAYGLATVWHETAMWMQPIREGAGRVGVSYKNEDAIRAVTAIYNKGIIRNNYALPAGPYRLPYYGRGLVQITWYDNYKKFADMLNIPLDKKPDLALDWDTALDIMILGMEQGLFRKAKIGDYKLPEQFVDARNIINGDVRTNGPVIAKHAQAFLSAIKEK